MAQLEGKVIAITGAGSGIGAATARESAARGALLALSDINEAGLNEVVDELRAKGSKVKGTKVDVTKADQVDAWIAATVEQFGRLDGAANVAGVYVTPGVGAFTAVVDITDEQWNFIMGINLTGLFNCLRAELRVMRRGASVLNVSSLAGLTGHYGIGAYSASKHGVVGLSRTAAKEMGRQGIRVNVLAPGIIDTPMVKHLLNDGGSEEQAITNTQDGTVLGRFGTPEEMAKTICFALSDDSSYTTGAVFSADGGVHC